jgi:hypothetical protein
MRKSEIITHSLHQVLQIHILCKILQTCSRDTRYPPKILNKYIKKKFWFQTEKCFSAKRYSLVTKESWGSTYKLTIQRVLIRKYFRHHVLLQYEECIVHCTALTLGKCIKCYCNNELACILYVRCFIMTATYTILLVKQFH